MELDIIEQFKKVLDQINVVEYSNYEDGRMEYVYIENNEKNISLLQSLNMIKEEYESMLNEKSNYLDLAICLNESWIYREQRGFLYDPLENIVL